MNAHQRRVANRSTGKVESTRPEKIKLYPHQEHALEMIRNLPQSMLLDLSPGRMRGPVFCGMVPSAAERRALDHALLYSSRPEPMILIYPEWQPGGAEQSINRLKVRRNEGEGKFKIDFELDSLAQFYEPEAVKSNKDS